MIEHILFYSFVYYFTVLQTVPKTRARWSKELFNQHSMLLFIVKLQVNLQNKLKNKQEQNIVAEDTCHVKGSCVVEGEGRGR